MLLNSYSVSCTVKLGHIPIGLNWRKGIYVLLILLECAKIFRVQRWQGTWEFLAPFT